jgi:hypothetical protein
MDKFLGTAEVGRISGAFEDATAIRNKLLHLGIKYHHPNILQATPRSLFAYNY